MVQPTDYTVKTIDPTEVFTKTLGMYQGIEQNKQTLEANKLSIDAARQKIETDRAGQERLRQIGELVTRAASPGATRADLEAVLPMTSSPEQFQAFQDKLASMTITEKQAQFTPALQVVYALQGGQPGVAEKMLLAQATAQENSGDVARAAQTRALAETIKEDGGVTVLADFKSKLVFDKDVGAPALDALEKSLLTPAKIKEADAKAKSAVSQSVIDAVGADNAKDFAALDKSAKILGNRLTVAQIAETNQRVTDARVAAKRLADDNNVKLTAASQATVNRLVTDSVTNQQIGINNLDFARRVAESNIRGGWFGNANKFIESVGGDVNLLRIEGKRLINSSIIAGLPAGAASDSDINMAKSGYPDNANAKQLSSYMRGAAKVKLIESQQQSDTAEWLSMNGTLGPARRPMLIGGREVRPGETLTKYNARAANQIVQDVNKQMGTVPQTQPKPTFRQPAPASSRPGWGKASIVPGA